jgi:hypothetical protein
VACCTNILILNNQHYSNCSTGNCYINKRDYEHGEKVVIGCKNCSCTDGIMNCDKLICPKLDCPQEKWITVPDECCKYCPGNCRSIFNIILNLSILLFIQVWTTVAKDIFVMKMHRVRIYIQKVFVFVMRDSQAMDPTVKVTNHILNSKINILTIRSLDRHRRMPRKGWIAWESL